MTLLGAAATPAPATRAVWFAVSKAGVSVSEFLLFMHSKERYHCFRWMIQIQILFGNKTVVGSLQ